LPVSLPEQGFVHAVIPQKMRDGISRSIATFDDKPSKDIPEETGDQHTSTLRQLL
jgi:hypothetical protein